MRKTDEIIQKWKEQCTIPTNIVFSIEIPRSDFEQMIKEIEEQKEEIKRLKAKNRDYLFHNY